MFNVYICNFLSDSLVPSVFLPPHLFWHVQEGKRLPPTMWLVLYSIQREREFRAIEHIMSAIGIIKTGSSFLLLPSFFFLLIQQPLSCCAVGLIGVNGKKELETWRCRALLGLATASLACTCKLFKKKKKKKKSTTSFLFFFKRFFFFC